MYSGPTLTPVYDVVTGSPWSTDQPRPVVGGERILSPRDAAGA
jgi:hypothetical protein